ncbi:unnamed protein product [Closterium sp. Yama58-4]|nr:unnamed protein product [Closterium sp. Yama58-4]
MRRLVRCRADAATRQGQAAALPPGQAPKQNREEEPQARQAATTPTERPLEEGCQVSQPHCVAATDPVADQREQGRAGQEAPNSAAGEGSRGGGEVAEVATGQEEMQDAAGVAAAVDPAVTNAAAAAGAAAPCGAETARAPGDPADGDAAAADGAAQEGACRDGPAHEANDSMGSARAGRGARGRPRLQPTPRRLGVALAPARPGPLHEWARQEPTPHEQERAVPGPDAEEAS